MSLMATSGRQPPAMSVESSVTLLNEAAHPVVFYSDGIGDSLLSLPSLRALAAIFKDRLTLIHDRSGGAVFFGDVKAKLRVGIDVTRSMYCGKFDAFFDVRSVVREISTCDLFILLTPWNSISVMTCISAIRPRVTLGFCPELDVCLQIHSDS